MKYKHILVSDRGGLDAVQIVEGELRPPAAEEVRVRILAAPVVRDDVAVRIGNRPLPAKPPFTPGYSFVGRVDKVGEGVTRFAKDDRVAALVQFGGHAEFIYCKAEELVKVPEDLDPAEASVLILNYLVAYQTIHRVAKAKAGDRALVIGASGGVGTALLDLGKLTGLKLYGLASRAKHSQLVNYGADLIDYHSQDFVEFLRRAEPDGLDFVFNGMGEEYFERGLAVLRRGGALVHYGGPQSTARLVVLVVKYLFYNLWPNGKTIKGYGTHRLGVDLFKQDWLVLFGLLKEGRIRPIIADRLSIPDAPKAYARLEVGSVVGTQVLLAPELL